MLMTHFVLLIGECTYICPLACRSLNELRVLLLESPRHSPGVDRDLSREVHKAEWRMKEQKLQDDIKTLREKLLLLVRQLSRVFHTCILHVICIFQVLTENIERKKRKWVTNRENLGEKTKTCMCVIHVSKCQVHVRECSFLTSSSLAHALMCPHVFPDARVGRSHPQTTADILCWTRLQQRQRWPGFGRGC